MSVRMAFLTAFVSVILVSMVVPIGSTESTRDKPFDIMVYEHEMINTAPDIDLGLHTPAERLASSPPIRINSDTEMDLAFPSRVIANLTIDASGAGTGIFVGNCTMPFKIDNCTVSDASGKGGMNFFMDAGIYISSCQYPIVRSCIITGGYAGIYIQDAYAAYITGNSASGGTHGIDIGASIDCRFRFNSIGPCINDGIYLRDSASANIFADCQSINNQGSGFFLTGTLPNGISNCTITGNKYDGIHGYRAQGINVQDCTVTGNGEIGFYLKDSKHPSAQRTNFSGNNRGAEFDGANGAIVIDCDFSHNTEHGYRLYKSNGSMVKRCLIRDNGKTGLGFNFVHNTSVVYCNISGNDQGVFLSANVSWCVFTANTFISNTNFAIEIWYSSPPTATIYNRIYQNTFNGNNAGGKQAMDQASKNIWNTTGSPGMGNWWSDWTLPDNNTDGIVDIPYSIDVGVADYCPLTHLPVIPENDYITVLPVTAIILLLMVSIAHLRTNLPKRVFFGTIVRAKGNTTNIKKDSLRGKN